MNIHTQNLIADSKKNKSSWQFCMHAFKVAVSLHGQDIHVVQ